MRKDLPLDVMKLDMKNLRTELSDIEIGHIPETDVIVSVARAVLQMQNQKKVSFSDML